MLLRRHRRDADRAPNTTNATQAEKPAGRSRSKTTKGE